MSRTDLTPLLRQAAGISRGSKATALSLTYSPDFGTWTVEAWSQLSDPVEAADGAWVRLTATYRETPDCETTLEDALVAFIRTTGREPIS